MRVGKIGVSSIAPFECSLPYPYQYPLRSKKTLAVVKRLRNGKKVRMMKDSKNRKKPHWKRIA
jgi:hypothetical protein